MAGEDTFDSPSLVGQDIDSSGFREASLPRVHRILQDRHGGIKSALQTRDSQQIQGFIARSADDINRVVVGSGEQDDIYSTPDTEIMHAFGLTIWRKPLDTQRLEAENLDKIVGQLSDGQMDIERLAKGVYFLEVLLHKYENGNGRVARGMKLLLDRSGEGEITEDDTRKVLGIGRESLTQTGEHSFKINFFNPDFERMVLGVAYFGLHKGLTQEQVVELKLNGTMPEEGLSALANKLNVPKETLKEDFIKFMVTDSDLSWCDF